MNAWKRYWCIALLGAVSAATVGCADLGPTHSPNWQATVVEALPKVDATADFVSACEWFPDSKGFPDFAARLAGPETIRQGVFVLSPVAVLFMSWDKHAGAYTVMFRAAYADLQGSRVETFGLNRRIVITGKDYRQQAFGISGPNDALIDRPATEKAAALLADRIAR